MTKTLKHCKKLTREQKKLIHATTKENAGAGWETKLDFGIKDPRMWENPDDKPR